MESGVGTAEGLAELTLDTESRHQELLELISSQSASSDNASSVGMIYGASFLLSYFPRQIGRRSLNTR
jgi:hypothetical protein